jgi:hypothetical protein
MKGFFSVDRAGCGMGVTLALAPAVTSSPSHASLSCLDLSFGWRLMGVNVFGCLLPESRLPKLGLIPP